MTNSEFCYWLQGFFEISKKGSLDKNKIQIIERVFKTINEPLGVFTQWFSDLLHYLQFQNYSQASIDYYTPEVITNLNSIFLHVIDNSYDTPHSPDFLTDVHLGRKSA